MTWVRTAEGHEGFYEVKDPIDVIADLLSSRGAGSKDQRVFLHLTGEDDKRVTVNVDYLVAFGEDS